MVLIAFTYSLETSLFGILKIACYSKFPILSSRILDYPSEYNGSVLYEIKIGEDTVTLINNHLESNKLTKADKVVYEDMLKSPEKEKVKSGARLLIRKLAEASAIRAHSEVIPAAPLSLMIILVVFVVRTSFG